MRVIDANRRIRYEENEKQARCPADMQVHTIVSKCLLVQRGRGIALTGGVERIQRGIVAVGSCQDLCLCMVGLIAMGSKRNAGREVRKGKT